MSGFWGSERVRVRAAAVGLVLLATLAAGAAQAKVRVGRLPGGTVERVRVTRHGVEVRTSGDSTTAPGWVMADSISNGWISVNDGDGEGMVRLFADANVKPGEHVDGDVVSVFGSVHVAGSVSGSAVAVFGSIDLAPGATVSGDAVAVGGGVLDPPGSHVGGQTVSVGFLPLTLGLPGLPIVLAFIFLGWLITVFFGWVFSALFGDRLARIAITSSRRTFGSLVLGLLSGPMVPVIAVLLMVTVIGLPIGFLLPFVYVAIVYAGQIAALDVLGRKLLRKPLGERAGVAPVAAGSTLVGLFFVLGALLWGVPGPVRTIAVFFHLVGSLVLVALSCIGTGAFLLSRAGSRPREFGEVEPSAPAPIAGVHETA